MLNKTRSRYAKESGSNCNLSCGSNLDVLNITPGESILDLGCGRGNETIQAALLTGPEGRVTGLDITPDMIDVARTNVREAGIMNASFILGDIENLPFNNAVFDAVMSNCVINHARSKEKVYREIFRVLKSKGRFIISDAVTKYPLPSEVKNDPEAWAQCFGGAVTEEEYLQGIVAAGFDHMQILNRREYVKSGYDFISLTIMAVKGVKR